MGSASRLQIAVLHGDGIGVEVMDACLRVLEALSRRTALRFDCRRLPGGANAYCETGSAFTDQAMHECERADAILFGAMGLPDVRYPDGTEIAPQLDIRVHLELYAGVRPIRALPGLPPVLRDPRAEAIDFVILREQTEGLYWSRGRGAMEGVDTAVDTMHSGAVRHRGRRPGSTEETHPCSQWDARRLSSLLHRGANEQSSSGTGKLGWPDACKVHPHPAQVRRKERAVTGYAWPRALNSTYPPKGDHA